MISKYKHISFDLDGTLVHTTAEHRYEVVPETIRRLEGNLVDEATMDKFWFEPNRSEVIEKEFGLNPEDFWNEFREVDTIEKRSAATWAYEDAERALRKLKDMGKTISIVTGAPHFIAEMEIKKLNGAPHDYYFSITDSEFLEKPDPASMELVLKDMKIKPEDTLYIGNSNEDARYAKNAGMDFLYLERREHDFYMEDYSIGTINSLDELFIGINKE